MTSNTKETRETIAMLLTKDMLNIMKNCLMPMENKNEQYIIAKIAVCSLMGWVIDSSNVGCPLENKLKTLKEFYHICEEGLALNHTEHTTQ